MVKVLKSLLSTMLVLSMLLNLVVYGAEVESEELIASLNWTSDFEQGEWKNGEAAFLVSDFEPGSEVVRYFKIENGGELAFSYDIRMVASEMGTLASVLDVYCKKEITSNVTVANMTKIGTLAEVLDGAVIADGSIVPDGESVSTAYTKETVVAVALKMADNVPKEFMSKATGDFSIQLNLTSFDEANKFKVKFKNTNKYLYRVGNANDVALSSLFEAVDGAEIGNVKVEIKSLDENSDVLGTYTANASDWGLGTIKFSGTGPVEVTIDDDGYANAVSLKLEVVNATNVTKYSELKNANCVLLDDITMTNDSCAIQGTTLYGNGFTFDVTGGGYSGTGYVSSNYLVLLNNATLDNVKIVGSVYTQYGAEAENDYNRATVLSTGTNRIINSYISNCASPLRVNDGKLELVNSTLKGGNFANLDIRGGNIVLDNLTTINQVNGNDLAADGTVVAGFGVVVFYENVLNTTTVEVRNGIKQYNNLSQAQANKYIQDYYAKQLTGVMFGTSCSDIQYRDANNDVWVNSGILSMTDAVGDANISDVNGFTSKSVSFAGKTGFVHTRVPDATVISANIPAYQAIAQGYIAPSYNFDYTTKNTVDKTDGSNEYCYYDSTQGAVLISFDEGGKKEWDTSILTAKKGNVTLPYTVSMNGADYTNKKITFTESGEYIVSYTYTDPYNYKVDIGGNIVKQNVSYTKNIKIIVSAVKPAAKNAEFTFGSSGQATEKITIGNNTYISATGVEHNNSTWSYITVNGQKVYYPIVEATIVSKKTAYFNVFKNVVTITDYADGGTGATVTYGSSTKSMPSGLTVVKGIYKPYADISSNWSTLNDTQLTYQGASKVFKYAGSSDASATPTTYNNVLCFKSPEVSNPRDEYITIAQYSYTDATNRGCSKIKVLK